MYWRYMHSSINSLAGSNNNNVVSQKLVLISKSPWTFSYQYETFYWKEKCGSTSSTHIYLTNLPVLCPQAIQLSRDGQYLLTGGDNGIVMVWQVWDLKRLFAYPGCDAGIRSMALSYDQRWEQSLLWTRAVKFHFCCSDCDFLWVTDSGDYLENSVLAKVFL